MIRSSQRRLFGVFAVLSLLLYSNFLYADLIVVPTVTPVGSLFHYDYTITNDLAVDVILVDILVVQMDLSLSNLFAPLGFQAIYDPGLGLVTFLPEPLSVELFAAGSSIGGFGFDSALEPGDSSFEALSLLGEPIVGPTQAPVAVAAVSESDSATLLFLVLMALFAIKLTRGHPHPD